MMPCLWVKLAFFGHVELMVGVFGSREEATWLEKGL